MSDEKNITFVFTEEAAKVIAKKAFSKKYGARNLRRLIQTDVEDKMANLIIESREKSNIMFSLGADEKGELIIRNDDKPEVVLNRLETYHKQTAPLKDFYEKKGLLKTVVGQEEVADTTRLTFEVVRNFNI